jgi:hypothetical protein
VRIRVASKREAHFRGCDAQSSFCRVIMYRSSKPEPLRRFDAKNKVAASCEIAGCTSSADEFTVEPRFTGVDQGSFRFLRDEVHRSVRP